VIAVMFPFVSLGLQKNPAGQFVADALLLVIGVPRLARYRILVPLLVYGLFATQSRGAIVACAGGVVVILAFRWMHSPRQALGTAIAIAAVAVLAFAVMPATAQSFITSYSSQGETGAAWNVRYRLSYQHDALTIIRAHPWLGVGVGSYGNAVAANKQLTPTTDPHDVLLLQAAEGGWAFAASFVLLILGTTIALVRLRHVELAAAAVAVLLATAAHGLVDIYWVRGTPVLGWLLVGMVCALAWQNRQGQRT
jgi:O-antigen ligase